MADKLRIHQLAKQLNVDSKTILAKCRAEQVDVKNHMSTVSAGLAATIGEWFSESSGGGTATETAEKVDLKKVRKPRKPRAVAEAPVEVPAVAEESATEDAPPIETPAEPVVVPESAPVETVEPAPVEIAAQAPAPDIEPEPEPEPEQIEAPVVEAPEVVATVAPDTEVEVEAEPEAEVEEIVPAGPQNVPVPVQLQGPRVIRVEEPDRLPAPRRAPRFRQTGLSGGGGGPAGPPGAPAPAGAGSAAGRRTRSKTYQGEDAKKKRSTHRRRGSDAGEQLREWKDSDLQERQERLRGATGRRVKRRASEGRGSVEHRAITTAQVTEPIVLKEFCAATGLSMVQLTPKFMSEFKILPNINMHLERAVAELLAEEFDIELTVVAARSPLDDIRDEFKNRERPNLKTRAPVVTFLGHVDHGKTSLLDAIRETRVTKGEAGGITQHMGAYYFERDDLRVTFLDTPGHQAFTAMRARGANLTDVVVLVVAADDGVMPQTREAINHAKAAGVPIVVALNKIDIPGVDENKVFGQLAEQELVPTEWGGNVDVIRTSATSGTGIDTLVEHLSTLSELLELKGDPTQPAHGRVIEAEMKPGVGAVARILIQDGSIKKGDFIVCGPGFGKVRSLKDDHGRDMDHPGPSMPVEVSGLDDLPSAGDEFFQVDSLKKAEQIAEQVKQQARRKSLGSSSKPKTLEDLFGQKKAGEIPELNVIVKADVQGSVDVLRQSLEEFPSDQVKLQVLHTAVGAINESDILLAEASGAIVVGFQVVPDSKVQRLADEKSVDIRLYRVIYDLMDDIKLALEGLLEPERRLERRGEAEVREIFKVGKIGTVAGCFMRDGVIARSHTVRVIRDGVVVRDESKLSSLRRFKDDVKEVKNGYECGIKLEGFDDIKPGDVIEAYEVVQVARSL